MIHDLSWAQISMGALKNNCQIIKERIGDRTKLAVVVKGNAYGHGAIPILQEMQNWEEVDMVIVGTIEECRSICEAGIQLPVLILNRVPVKYITGLPLEKVCFSAYDKLFLEELNEFAQMQGKTASVHLRVDVNYGGMGILPEKFLIVYEYVKSLKNIKITGIYIHPYSIYGKDENRYLQDLELFDFLISQISVSDREQLTIHAANSKAIFRYPQSHYDMVRAGVALYGLPYEEDRNFKLKQALSLWAKIVSCEWLNEKSRICYEDLYGAEKRKVAHISLGYWDAPFLLTSSHTVCAVKNNLLDIYGEPCMEVCCADITGKEDIIVGDPVCFLGDIQGVDVYSVMKRMGLTSCQCERICMTARRLKKVYLPIKGE